MPDSGTKSWECSVCGHVYDEAEEGTPLSGLPSDWECPVCGAAADEFEPAEQETDGDQESSDGGAYLGRWARSSDDREPSMAAIHAMAASGRPVIEPMRSPRATPLWDRILFKGAQLARLPIDESEPVEMSTVIGPRAAVPMTLDLPVFISHMSFGALSREAKLALAKGSAAVGTAMCSGEGGILPESQAAAHRYIFEIVPNLYSVTDENLAAASALEIKIGQSAKPGMGGHLPGDKVTEEIARVRQKPAGEDVKSPARFPDVANSADLAAKVTWLREKSGGKPIGIKLAAGDVEADLDVALAAGADFVTLDGRPGATGAAPKVVKDACSIPTVYALSRARKFLDASGVEGVSLVITGGLRNSADFAKALAMGADAIAIATVAMMAVGCQQYRVCHTGRCPVGIATQDPALRARLDVDKSAQRVANFLRATQEELAMFARLTGNRSVHDLSARDLCTLDSELATHTDILHA